MTKQLTAHERLQFGFVANRYDLSLKDARAVCVRVGIRIDEQSQVWNLSWKLTADALQQSGRLDIMFRGEVEWMRRSRLRLLSLDTFKLTNDHLLVSNN